MVVILDNGGGTFVGIRYLKKGRDEERTTERTPINRQRFQRDGGENGDDGSEECAVGLVRLFTFSQIQ